MIFWFTGQPGSGKSTLGKALGAALKAKGYQVAELDGDEFRCETGNTDYSPTGREMNVRNGQRRAAELTAQGFNVVAAFVSPHRALREEFKQSHAVLEIYVHSSRPSAKDRFRVPYYEPPLTGYFDIDTSSQSVEQSIELILESFIGKQP